MLIPSPVQQENRVSFGIAWFLTEADALEYETRYVKAYNRCYNGGWLDGHPCGRDKSYDKMDPSGNYLYAVTN